LSNQNISFNFPYLSRLFPGMSGGRIELLLLTVLWSAS